MNSREERDEALRAHALRGLESPFLEERLFEGESEAEWEPRVAGLVLESLLQNAFAAEEGTYAEQELDPRQGKTIYLPVQLNNTIPPKVGVFIPSGFHRTAEVDLIVYFHGHIIPDCKTYPREFGQGGIEYYWNTPWFKCLREDLVASGQQALLIAPTFKPIFASKTSSPRDYGDLHKVGKFDFLVNETLRQLENGGELPGGARVRHIVLSGHSGGGLPMQVILDTQNALQKNIKECWGFESLYFGTSSWAKWLANNPAFYFRHYRRATAFVGPAKTLSTFKNFADISDGTGHCSVVQQKWRQALASSRVLQGGGKSPAAATSGALSGLFSLLAGLPGLASLPVTFMNALLHGFQDENHLTNLIFFARHPELGGRKLTKSDPQRLKDEWLEILRTIVRPAIGRLKAAAAGSSAGTPPAQGQPVPGKPVVGTAPDQGFSLTGWKLAAGKIVVARYGDQKKGTLVTIEEAPSVFLPEIIRMAGDMAINGKKSLLAAKLDPEKWFKQFTRITFLGRPLKQGQYLHLEMAALLKAVEAEMVRKYGGSAKSVGDMLLNNSSEGIAGSRLTSSTATFSMHMFGLAVDVNYLGNPYIQSGNDVKALNNVLRNAALLLNQPVLSYQRGNEKDTFDRVQQLDVVLERYFGLLDDPAELERLRRTSSSPEWRGLSAAAAKLKIQQNLDNLAGLLARGGDKKEHFKRHAILDLDKRFVVQMEASGLYWGGHYGDMMHFDMRNHGVGIYIERARLAYAGKVKRLAKQLFAEKRYGSHSPG